MNAFGSALFSLYFYWVRLQKVRKTIFSAFGAILCVSEKMCHSTFKAIKISVTPVIVASVMPVKGQPEITGATSGPDRHYRSPTAKAAVGIIKGGCLHPLLAINTVFRGRIEIVSANKEQFSVDSDEGSAGLRPLLAVPDKLVTAKRVLGFKENVNI